MAGPEVSYEEELSDIERFLLDAPARVGSSSGEPTSVVETLHPFQGEHRVHLPPLDPPKTLAELVAHPEAHPLILNVLMLKEYGQDYLAWAMPAVERGLEKFGVPCDLSVAKVMAAQLCHTTEGPWTLWEQFVPVVSAFTDVLPDFDTLQAVDPIQITVAVGIMNTLDSRDIWSDEVKRFISASYHYYDVMLPIPPVQFVTVQAPWLPHDREALMRAWPETARTGKPTMGGIEGIQLQKMLALAQGQQVFLNRLRHQLALVPR